MKTTIAFPGLGIEQFELNRAAFTIPIGDGITVYWYGIIIALGIVLAFTYFLWRATKFEHIREDDCYNLALFTVPIAIIGARILYVITNPEKYDSLLDAISIWNGGIAIYGAIIFGAITILVFSKVKKIMVFRLLDAVSPAVMIGQILGRWGNFFNGEAYGWSEGIAKLPWRMQLEGAYRTEIINGIKTKVSVDFVHPTFLYESLWNLLGFVIINFLYKKKKFSGQVFLMYVTWYGLGRGFIELLRTDSLYVFETIKLNSVIGFITCIAGIVGLVLLYIKSQKESSELENYKAAYVGGESAEVNDNTEESTVTEPEEKEVEDNGDNT
ncbi:MAG: prolipoprotein diacylglyceryl transferase [Clostridia bacterium]|nr:prolipoprotein diacylglyceryl transferase [Clostridia bacterium]